MEISAVRLRNSYQINYIDTNNVFVNHNSLCIVETEHGVDIGSIIKCPRLHQGGGADIKGRLIRKTTEDDMKELPEIEGIEARAYQECRDRAAKKNLEMKLIIVKCLFDKTKIIFYFVADNRVDFRELVRELASIFKTRIEMRQIGVRDEARLIGGYGPCGKELCCVHQKEEFEPVSIKMAKEQNLNLNSMKISGMCGRLLCCLSYEYETYRTLNRTLPNPGTQIIVEGEAYNVINVDTLREAITIRNKDRVIEISRNDIEKRGNVYHLKDNVINRLTNQDEENVYDDGLMTH
ncbi:MAG: stage 0 sporulation protein [Spirochaetes bacterium]|nr:stage 0 sporulation protein [Spirochaetota bacterium]